MPKTTSLLLLKKAVIEHLSVSSRKIGDGDPSGYETRSEPSMTFTMFKNPDAQEFRIAMRLKIEWGDDVPSPLRRINVAIAGEFGFDSEVSEETIKTYIPVLGIANLVGVARGVVASATALFPRGPFLIPLFNVNDLIENFLNKLEAEAAQKAPVLPETSDVVAEESPVTVEKALGEQ